MNRAGAVAFGVAAIARIWLLVHLGTPPRHGRLDANNYLELALGLWRDGHYGSVFSTQYPPLYPMFIAPVFALPSNEARFLALHVMHGLILVLGTLALLPMLRSVMGERAWWVLAALQALAGATYHGLHARSEVLFIALVAAATGAVWGAVQRPTFGRWLLVGVACGAAVACRRAGVVLPLAAAVVLLGVRPGRSGLLGAGVGFALGLFPEALAAVLHGEVVRSYHEGVVGSHVAPLATLWGREGGLELAIRTVARQLGWLGVATGGAPLVLGVTLLRREVPRSIRAAGAFAGTAALGMVALSALHILRYAFGNPDAEAWHVYPRYLDPAEIALVATAVAGFAALPATASRMRIAWALPALPFVAFVAGETVRYRGSRFIPLRAVEGTSWEGWYPHALLFASVVVAATAGTLLWRRAWGGGAAVVVVAAVGWALSPHVAASIPAGGAPVPVPKILRDIPVDAPVAIMVGRRPLQKRDLYAPAFRSDHDVRWVLRGRLGPWLEDHPKGRVLVRRFERAPGHRLGLRLDGATGDWGIWTRIALDAPRPDSLPSAAE